MQGDQKVDELMRPVHAAIKRHVKDGTAVTDIYNRAYEAVAISMDAKDGEIKALRARAEKAEAALRVILDCVDYTAGACGVTEMVGGALPATVIARAKDALRGGKE